MDKAFENETQWILAFGKTVPPEQLTQKWETEGSLIQDKKVRKDLMKQFEAKGKGETPANDGDVKITKEVDIEVEPVGDKKEKTDDDDTLITGFEDIEEEKEPEEERPKMADQKVIIEGILRVQNPKSDKPQRLKRVNSFN